MSSEIFLQQMLHKAQQAMQNAYAPYSNFFVGACIRTSQNNLYAGCNNENASYSLTQCAEASAIASMVTGGEKRIAEIVVVASHATPCSPCGSCRQRIREFADLDIKVHMYGAKGDYKVMTLGELLPYSFGPDFLK